MGRQGTTIHCDSVPKSEIRIHNIDNNVDNIDRMNRQIPTPEDDRTLPTSPPETSPSADDDEDFQPTATLQMLRRRGELLQSLRRYFDEHGFWEVETPVLSHDITVDAHLEPFETEDERGNTFYLQTSPEFAMKRLLAAGANAIYQITRAFRREEQGRRHNPEFTLLEWYRVGDTYHDQMTFTQRLVQEAFRHFAGETDSAAQETVFRHSTTPDAPFERLSYDDAFCRYLGTRVLHRSCAQLRRLSAEQGIRAPVSLRGDDRDGWLNLLLSERIEPQLGLERPVFLYDYPASQAALARIRPGEVPVAERFELYINGVEICNGYQELTDPREFQRRIDEQSALRARDGKRPLRRENRLLTAMQAGIPEASGVALGVDRLMMVLFGLSELSQLVAFPVDRA